MKKLITSLISLINKLLTIHLLGINNIRHNHFYLFSLTSSKINNFQIVKSTIKKSSILIKGTNNHVGFREVDINGLQLLIEGDNNILRIEKGVKIYNTTLIMKGNNLSVHIGSYSSIAGARIVNQGNQNQITIGNNCMFSDQIEIWASDTHPIYSNERLINPEKSITILDRVWIGSRATILKGVNIGSDSVVGMNSVITKDVKSNSIVAGNPASTIKENITWKVHHEETI